MGSKCDRSPTCPIISKDELYQFLATCQQDEVEAELNLQTWLREQR
jgi:hypothetical protein